VSSGWAINIDIEGFSQNYEYSEDRKTFAILAIGELMHSIEAIGTRCYPGDQNIHYSDRLFAHQFGDGFIIISDYPEPTSERAISIAVAIMRHMISKGYATKAAISNGDMSDIRGCYPHPMRDANDERVDMGMGLMTIISVMGTSLTKAHRLSNTKSGSVLILDKEIIKAGLPDGVMISDGEDNCINWISSNLPLSHKISDKANLLSPTPEALLVSFNNYCKQKPCPTEKWINSTLSTIQ